MIEPELVARFRDSLENLWPADEREGALGLAVSGGPDSLALLLLAAAALPGEIAVASVDHGLREESTNEVALVASLCASLGVPFTPLLVEVGGGNIQAKAREARYAALGKWALDNGLSAVVTAHHADDSAETLLMRLARGSGLSGLAGVRRAGLIPGLDMLLLRPLLSWRKSELETIVAACDITPCRDLSNEDIAFDRVRIRRHLSENPWLDPEQLSASAQHLDEAWRALEWFAELDFDEMVVREDVGAKELPVLAYCANVPRAVAIETISRIVVELGGMVSRREAGRAFDRLWRGENASLGGVLAIPNIEQIEGAGVPMRVWRFSPEPPRAPH